MKKIAIVVASVFLISGCATPGQNAAAGGTIGALVGCFVFSAAGGKCADGAIIGGAVGAVAGLQYESKKVASANDVNSQARRLGVNVPDNNVVVGSYSVVPNSHTVALGSPIVTESNIQLIGNSKRVPRVEETLALVDPDGIEHKAQPAIVTAVDGAGAYTTKGIFKTAQGMAPGNYTIKSALSMDGKVVRNGQFNVQVAVVDGHQVVRLASAE